MKRTLFAILVFLGALSAPPGAMAHSELEEIVPANGSVTSSSTRLITLRFNEEVTLPRVTLRGPSGRIVAGSMVRRGESSLVMFRSRANLPVGAYRIQWRVRSADGHWVSGTSSFNVK